jgi:alcohol dehydrogenase class IV
MNFNFNMPTRVISGEGCVKNYNFASWGRKCFIITGKTGARASGVLDDLEKVLTNQCVDYFIYDSIEQNPSVDTCFEAGALANEFGATFMLGVGGGSAMDAAKAASVFATNPHLDKMSLFSATGIKTPLPNILIGTTAGTGSEVTPVAVLNVNNGEVWVKKSFRSTLIYAKVALCDPEYTMSMSWEQTANTALDTICHAVESLYSMKAGSFEILYATEAVKVAYEALIKAHWKAVIEKRTIEFEQREKLLYASIMGGMAINGTGTCFPHTLGYALTTIKGVPHGKACALFLGEFVRTMQNEDENRTKLLIEAVKEESIETFLLGIQSMAGDSPILTNEEAFAFSELVKDAPALKNSIRAISNEEANKIYNKLFVR